MYDTLYKSIIFRGFLAAQTEDIRKRLNGRVRTFQKGEIVILEESRFEEIGILLSGELCKAQCSADGAEQVIQILHESFVVGVEIAVSEKKTSPYSVYALKDSKIYFFKVSALEQEGILTPEERILIYKNCAGFLASEDIRKYKKIRVLSLKGARERIMTYLESQQKRYGSNEFDIEFNREQMAAYLGLNRSVLSHELKRMEREGLLAFRKNHFCLKEKK